MMQTPVGPAAPSGANHRTTLDGLRALAIIGVLFVHSGTPGFRSGWIGVDLFFALSGFLITTLLLMESSGTGRIAFGAFMVRRMLRLMPAYFLYAAFITALIWCWHGSIRSSNGGWTAGGLTAALWAYAINFVPQGGIWNGQDLTVHLWSLSVEQQYYLIWPVLVLMLHRRPNILGLLGALLTCTALIGFILAPPGLYRDAMLFTRGFSLVAASTFAVFMYRNEHLIASNMLANLVGMLGLMLLAALFFIPYGFGWSEETTRGVFIPFLVPIFIFFIARLWHLRNISITRSILRWPPLVYIGKISYGIYLYHEAIRVATWYIMKPLMSDWPISIGFIFRLAIYFIVSGLVAAVSYEMFEKKFLRITARFRPQRTDVASAIGARLP